MDALQFLWAFLIGGAICVIGQLLISLTRLTPAKILVLFVTAGVILGGIGVYQPLVDFAGAGATVPLTGFGNLLAQGAIKGAKEGGVIGAFTGGITSAAGGITAAIGFGYLFALIAKPKTKS
ncbi:MAG: stage V sporulation protein AE [Eubacteriales bacterium]|nr:stage V sporulation protein AE [Eubacteriales bacterium]